MNNLLVKSRHQMMAIAGNLIGILACGPIQPNAGTESHRALQSLNKEYLNKIIDVVLYIEEKHALPHVKPEYLIVMCTDVLRQFANAQNIYNRTYLRKSK